jgi:nucleotide-binding universal stress UspA family protein
MTRVVVWITEGTWAGCVDAAAALAPVDSDIVLLHVADADVADVMYGSVSGLLGRGSKPGRLDDPADHLLSAAAKRLNRPVATMATAGRVQDEVVAACEGADLLVCARDGRRDRPGPHSIGKHTRFVVDHAPCAVLLVWS